MGVSVLTKQDEGVELILEDLRGESSYPIEMYLDKLIDILSEKKSLYLSLAYENCIHFNISPLFVYLYESELSDVGILLMYEIIHLNKLNVLDLIGSSNLTCQMF